MYSDDPATTVRTVLALKSEHRDLDLMIAQLVLDPGNDDLELKRLKRRKLFLKDTIAMLESQLIPDLDA